MAGLLIHIVVFAAVNAFLIGVWMVTGNGTEETLRDAINDPIQAAKDGVWPVYVIASWGVGLVIHAGVWASLVIFGGPRRRARSREQRWHEHRGHAPSAPSAPPAAGAPHAGVGRELGRDAAKLAGAVIESLSGRLANAPERRGGGEPAGRQWVAVMFTDIAGSTELNEVLGDDAYMGVLTEHRRMVREHVSTCGGTEVSTQGDGFLVRFAGPDDAVACAIAIQRELHDTRATGTFTPELRIGIHAGEAVSGDNDLVGRVINLAARVAGLAEAGEILVTEPVADHASPSVQLVDRGLQPLRGIAQPRHLLAVVWSTADEMPTTTRLDDETRLDDQHL